MVPSLCTYNPEEWFSGAAVVLKLWSGALLGSSKGNPREENQKKPHTCFLKSDAESGEGAVKILLMWGFALSTVQSAHSHNTTQKRKNSQNIINPSPTHLLQRFEFLVFEARGPFARISLGSPAVSCGIIRFKWYWSNSFLYFPCWRGLQCCWTWLANIA